MRQETWHSDGKNTSSFLAGDVKLVDCLRMLIDPPIEVESSCCESLVGLLTRASSTRSSLPRVSYPSGFRCSGSPRLQWRGPCRVRTGFPNKPDRQIYIPEHGKESSQTFAKLLSNASGRSSNAGAARNNKADPPYRVREDLLAFAGLGAGTLGLKIYRDMYIC